MKKEYPDPFQVNKFSHKITSDFVRNNPKLYKLMNEINHSNPDLNYFSDYHCCESVWTHTLMVMSHLRRNITETIIPLYWKELLVAGLYHDIGKCFTQQWNIEKQKLTFYGHAAFSTVESYTLIKYLNYSLEQEIFILKLINYHQDLFLSDDASDKALRKLAKKIGDIDLANHLNILRSADSFGNISINGVCNISRTAFQRLEIEIERLNS